MQSLLTLFKVLRVITPLLRSLLLMYSASYIHAWRLGDSGTGNEEMCAYSLMTGWDAYGTTSEISRYCVTNLLLRHR
ncbi:hypothetical protein F5Y16DRAFT_363377 [Xylariaceae sp. FL0255]|nr:hypothetical protein F5Y16DRAFT_363377 [Xylariaceae sp. FL0255]